MISYEIYKYVNIMGARMVYSWFGKSLFYLRLRCDGQARKEEYLPDPDHMSNGSYFFDSRLKSLKQIVYINRTRIKKNQNDFI